jgi:hypothetical protein
MKVFACLLLIFGLSACASKRGWRMPDFDDGSTADAAAYGADGMYIGKEMPHRPDFKPWEFYYKHCSVNGDEAFYSKTSYDCAGPRY